ncbi:MAG: hypothetical protein ABJI43_03375 [Roseobacter sp.]
MSTSRYLEKTLTVNLHARIRIVKKGRRVKGNQADFPRLTPMCFYASVPMGILARIV